MMNEDYRECRPTIERFITSIGKACRCETASQSKSLQRLLEVYRLVAANKFDGLAGHLSKEVVYEWPHQSSDIAFSGHAQGRSDVISRLRQNFSEVCNQKPELLAAVVDGSTVRLTIREVGTSVRCGSKYSAEFEQTFEFDEDCRIQKMTFKHGEGGVEALARDGQTDHE